MSSDKSVVILVVEDNPGIRMLAHDSLTEAGFEVIVARTDVEAIAELERHGAHNLAGLVTDVQLECPMSGWDIAHRARELNPGLPIIYTTGDSGGDWSANGVPNSVLITKPFVFAQIIVALATLINQANTESPDLREPPDPES
jgi:CheY-like chemotaxis protein